MNEENEAILAHVVSGLLLNTNLPDATKNQIRAAAMAAFENAGRTYAAISNGIQTALDQIRQEEEKEEKLKNEANLVHAIDGLLLNANLPGAAKNPIRVAAMAAFENAGGTYAAIWGSIQIALERMVAERRRITAKPAHKVDTCRPVAEPHGRIASGQSARERNDQALPVVASAQQSAYRPRWRR